VDTESIDRIRTATFPTSRRGYDKHEVDRFLTRLAEWLETGGAEQSPSDAVRRELEQVGELTAKVLTEAHDAAERLRVQAEREAEGLTEGAQTQAAQTRAEADKILSEAQGVAETKARQLTTDADKYATKTRTDADRDAEQALTKARAEAKRIVDEANERKQDIESVIADLEARRDEVLESLERMSTELSVTATQHAKVTAEEAAEVAANVRDDESPDGEPGEDDEEDETRTMPLAKGNDGAPAPRS
jgi:DivIVA domain-containing protein